MAIRNRLPQAALLLVLVGILAWSVWPRPLSVAWVGCAERFSDGSCEVNDEPDTDYKPEMLRFWVDLPADASVRVFLDTHRHDATPLRANTGNLFELHVPSGAHTLTLIARSGCKFSFSRLHIREHTEPTWLRDARKLWLAGENDRALQLLDTHRGSSLTAQAHAAELQLRGRLALEGGTGYPADLEAARTLFEQAIVASREAHAPSAEAEATLWLANVLGKSMHRFTEADRRLRESGTCTADFNHAMWCGFWFGSIAYRRGNLPRALAQLERLPQLLDRFQNPFVAAEYHSLLARILGSLGRTDEADKEMRKVVDRELPRCRRAELLKDQAEFRLHLAEEAEDPRAALNTSGSPPEQLLIEALKLHQGCAQQPQIVTDLLLLAQTASLQGQWDKMARWLDQARPLVTQTGVQNRFHYTELLAQRRIADNDFRAGEALLLSLVSGTGETAESEAIASDDRWRAWVRIAQARAADGRRLAAIDAYRVAAQILDQAGIEVPLGIGRFGFYRRHAHALGPYLELLVAQGKLADAFTAMRHARTRTLQTLRNFVLAAQLPDQDVVRLREAIQRFQRVRREIDRYNAAAKASPAILQDNARKEALARLDSEQTRIVNEIAQLGSSISPDSALRPPGPGEVMLTCHPTPHDWLCLAADTTHIQAARVKWLARDVETSMLERDLAPLAPLLAQATRVTILPYGVMHDVDFGTLVLDGRPLEDDHRHIVYALDVPVTPRTLPPQPTQAVLALDPRDDTGFAVPLAQALVPRVEELRWQTIVQAGSSQLRAEGLPKPPTSLFTVDTLMRILPGTRLFFYFGHHDSRSARDDWLDLEQEQWSAMTILALSRAPELVMIFGCDTAFQSDKAAAPQDLNAAQAFLLRGSTTVIATSRSVAAVVANALAQTLFGLGGDLWRRDPVAALGQARRLVRESKLLAKVPPDVVADSLAAFRIYQR